MAAKIDVGKISPETVLLTNYTSQKVEMMKSDILSICHSVSSPSKNFNAKERFNEIKKYVSNYDRLLYAEISTYCYNLSSEEIGTFQGNLNSLVEYVYSTDYDNGIKAEKGKSNENEVELRERTKRIVIKLYDNVNLACAQLSSLRQSEEELHEQFKKEFEPAKAEITKEVNSQLITLVGIFTAIAFLVFGGFSSLTDVFLHIGDNLPKTVMLLSIWGLVICNGVFIFLSCVEKIVQKGSKLVLSSKNTVFCWTNLILLFVFLCSAWAYIVDKYNWGRALICFGQSIRNFIAIFGFAFITMGFIVVAICVAKNKDK